MKKALREPHRGGFKSLSQLSLRRAVDLGITATSKNLKGEGGAKRALAPAYEQGMRESR